MKFSAKNRARLKDLIEQILAALEAGEVSQHYALGALRYLAHISAEDEDAELKAWLKNPKTFQLWWSVAAKNPLP
jgi:hypothetical protein